MTNIPLKFILVFVTVSSFFGCLCGLQPQKSTTGFGVVSTPQLYGRSLETNTRRPDASSQTGRTFVPISQPYVLTSSGTDARLSSRSAKTWMLTVDGPQHSTHWSPGWFLRLELAYKQETQNLVMAFPLHGSDTIRNLIQTAKARLMNKLLSIEARLMNRLHDAGHHNSGAEDECKMFGSKSQPHIIIDHRSWSPPSSWRSNSRSPFVVTSYVSARTADATACVVLPRLLGHVGIMVAGLDRMVHQCRHATTTQQMHQCRQMQLVQLPTPGMRSVARPFRGGFRSSSVPCESDARSRGEELLDAMLAKKKETAAFQRLQRHSAKNVAVEIVPAG